MRSTIQFSAILLLSFFLFACSGGKKEVKEIIRPVKYTQVFLSGGEMSRTFAGVSKAGTETKLSFRVGGIVNVINVKVGDRVNKGDLIASIDNSDIKLQYDQAKASRKNAKAQKEHAEANLDRIKKLYENNNVSISEYERAKSGYDQAKAAHKSAKKLEDLQERQLSYGRIHSPVNGVVAMVFVEKNENVKPGDIITEISSGDEIEIKVGLPETFISKVMTGDTVNVEFSAFDNKIIEGVVSEVSFSSEASTYPVYVKLDGANTEIRPGMAADVTFSFSSVSDSEYPIVPTIAVSEDQNGNFVYVVVKSEDIYANVQKSHNHYHWYQAGNNKTCSETQKQQHNK